MKIHVPERSEGKKIVGIVGAGFAGLNAARSFADSPEFHVVLIDQRNHHLFQPLLYQVATAGLNVADIAVPIRSQFSDIKNVEVHLGKIDIVDLENKTLKSEGLEEEFGFDYLILACGVQHSYFGRPDWEEFAPGLKTLEQATEIRRRILSAFELAENEMDKKKQESLMTFIIVGAGPTGVELAGAIADISKTVLVHDFKRIDPSKAKVVLIEAGSRVLASFSESLSSQTEEALKTLGVEVRTSTRVKDINSDGVQVENEFISSQIVLWAAGVEASKMKVMPEVKKDRAGRIIVKEDLSIEGFKDCFVIGDMASRETSPKRLVPGVAPAAIQMGKFVADVIQTNSRRAFVYKDKGQMATIGKHKAVMSFQNIESTGFIAWIAWLFIHIFYLIGFKNKLAVFFQWGWNYVLSKRGARLIISKEWRKEI